MNERDFYEAFLDGITSAGLELRDHWHPDDNSGVTYKLRHPTTGRVMRYTIKYDAVGDAAEGSRHAAVAVARFFNRPVA